MSRGSAQIGRLAVVGLVVLAVAAESRAWVTGDSEDGDVVQGAAAVVSEPGGDLISAGILGSDQTVIRRHAAADGHELWRNITAGASSTIYGIFLTQDAAGDLLAALTPIQADGSSLGTIVKLDPVTGEEAWRLELPEARFFGITTDPSGDVAAVGVIGPYPSGHNTLVLKVSGQNGTELWREERSGSYPDKHLFQVVAPASNGDIFVAGSLAKPAPNRDPGDPGFSVLRFGGLDGEEIWWQEVGTFGNVRDLAIDGNGDVLAVGDDFQNQMLVAKLAGLDGSVLWIAPVPTSPENEGADAVVVDSSGDAYVAGSLAYPPYPSSNKAPITTLKLSGTTGSILWRHDAFSSTSSVFACCRMRDIELAPDGNVVAVGGLGNYYKQEVLALKLSPDTGEQIWRTNPGTDAPIMRQFAIAADGTIAVAASRRSCSNALYCGKYTVARLRGSTGSGFFPGCGDELDNDGDGATDYPVDAGCADASSPIEDPACDDAVDNDGDGLVDHPQDLGCASPSFDTEAPACNDGIDNDGDGAIDFPEDAGCSGPSSQFEETACQDGLDNDGDGASDHPEDLGCANPSSNTESPACQDGIDDDGDGLIDHPEDPGCALPSSTTEIPACQDGWDNDGDGRIDFDGGATAYPGYPPGEPDPDCRQPYQTREDPVRRGCGLGFELAPVLWLVAALRRRRMRAASTRA